MGASPGNDKEQRRSLSNRTVFTAIAVSFGFGAFVSWEEWGYLPPLPLWISESIGWAVGTLMITAIITAIPVGIYWLANKRLLPHVNSTVLIVVVLANLLPYLGLRLP